jgi:hypothetical protein
MTAPRNGADELPLAAAGSSPPPEAAQQPGRARHIVANDITWWMEKGADKIESTTTRPQRLQQDPRARNVGAYQICASSHGVVGCQDAEVLARPR